MIVLVQTPCSVVDVNTGDRIGRDLPKTLQAAFARGDRYTAANPNKDYRVTDRTGRPVPRSVLTALAEAS